MRPMYGEVSLRMDAEPAEVWALVSDVTRIGEFSPETFEAEWTRGSTVPEVGATFRGHVKRNGIGPIYWAPCKVTACEPEAHFEFAVVGPGGRLNTWGYKLRPEDGGTVVTEYFRLSPMLPLRLYWAVLGPLRGRTNERGMRTTLARMKQVVER
jgi:Polyketide cyclase / dehydrase and lipid transport